MRLRLRPAEGEPVLGTNMHVLGGHARINFVRDHYRPGDVLDAGSGQGGFSLYLHQRGCNKVTMLDILPAEVPDPEIAFVQGNLYELEDTPKWDTIMLMEVIEHLESPELVIARCYDALKPGGRILITTPWVGDWDYVRDHVWRFDLDGVAELLKPYQNTQVFQDPTFVYGVIER